MASLSHEPDHDELHDADLALAALDVERVTRASLNYPVQDARASRNTSSASFLDVHMDHKVSAFVR